MSIEPPNAGYAIRRLHAVSEAHVRGLAELLIDCVDGGASVSFMHPLSLAKASEFLAAWLRRWRRDAGRCWSRRTLEASPAPCS